MATYMKENIPDEKSASDCKSDPEHSSSLEQMPKPNLYFYSILCNPHLLQNPNSSQHSFMQDLFKNKQIKKVRKSRDYLSIDVVEKKESRSVNVLESYQFQNAELKKELTSTYNHLTNVPSDLEEQSQVNIADAPGETQFYQWLNQVKNKALIAWYIPFCGKGIKLRSFSMSLGLLNLLDYKIDDLALDIQNLGANSFDVIDGPLYKSSFLMIINAIRKFKLLKQNGDITKEEIIRQSQTTLINQIKGRGNRKLTVETKICMISQNVVCHQILRVVDQKQVRDHQRKLNRQTALYQVEQVAFNCLSKVAKLPRIVDPSNSSKICSYIQIKPDLPQKTAARKQTQDEAGSMNKFQLQQI